MGHCQEVTVVPVIISALGSFSCLFDEWMRKLPMKIEFGML